MTFFWHKGSHDAGKFIHIFHVFKKNGLIDNREGYILVILIVPFLLINILEYKQHNNKKKRQKEKY